MSPIPGMVCEDKHMVCDKNGSTTQGCWSPGAGLEKVGHRSMNFSLHEYFGICAREGTEDFQFWLFGLGRLAPSASEIFDFDSIFLSQLS
jgi:hypothetical protein